MNKSVVLFVHGLGGSEDTWGHFEKFLTADKGLGVDVRYYEYPSPILGIPVIGLVKNICQYISTLRNKVSFKFSSIQDLAQGLKTYIDEYLQDYDEIILVGHSLGGLIIRQYLLSENIANRTTKIQKIALYAVPNLGSALAAIGRLFSGKNNPHVQQLCTNTDFLELLNENWSRSSVERNLDITFIVGGKDSIVTKQSAEGSFRNNGGEPKFIPDRGHINIVKPECENDLAYTILRNIIKKKISITNNLMSGCKLVSEWAKSREFYTFPFCVDDKRRKYLEEIISHIGTVQKAIRIQGLSGLGKTRLVYEAAAISIKENDQSIAYFDAFDGIASLIVWVKNSINDRREGTLIVDNCDIKSHDLLLKEIERIDSNLCLITIDYSEENIGTTPIIKLDRFEDKYIREMLAPNYADKIRDTELAKIVNFAQGFPQLAVLLAEARLNESENLGALNDDFIAKKLLWGNDVPCQLSEKILQGCALFENFGLDADVSNEYKYIAEEILGVDVEDFYACIKTFARKGLIDRRGRFAQLVPKPLAIRLAAQWWGNSTPEKQTIVIGSIPQSMEKSFCNQISKLDFLTEVKELTASLCGIQGPFGHAEVILSNRGSLLFRALVEVNPEATSNALSRILSNLSDDELYRITDEVRRNLVWSLEKLCYRKKIFNESAKSLLLLASAENEIYSNNSQGIFSQLFRVLLSGTEATPQQRFSFLRNVINSNNPKFDLIVLSALKNAIQYEGGGRISGAEDQGTSAPIQEWAPVIWQDIFDYWNEAFELLIILFDRGDPISQSVKNIIGNSIRYLSLHGRILMLDKAIAHIIEVDGIYWPSALESINNALDYDSNKIPKEGYDALLRWKDLLAPNNGNLEDKLKIIVINPPWAHKKDLDNRYVDIAARDAEVFGKEISKNVGEIIPYISLLLVGEQKQTYIFGRSIASENIDIESLVGLVTSAIKEIEKPNLNFLTGLLNGIHGRSKASWDMYLDAFSVDIFMSKYYPDLILSGTIENSHLDILIDLAKQNSVPLQRISLLGYGGATNNIEAAHISSFCMKLGAISSVGACIALDILFMHCFVNNDEFNLNKEALVSLVTSVPINDQGSRGHLDIHHWKDIIDKFLFIETLPFFQKISIQILEATRHKLSLEFTYHYVKPTLRNIFKIYGAELWPLFGSEILSASPIQRLSLQSLFEKEDRLGDVSESLFSALPLQLIIDWCADNGEAAIYFVASTMDIFVKTESVEKEPSELFLTMLEKFGSYEWLGNTIAANIGSRGWTGSIVPILYSDRNALSKLLNHSNAFVRDWCITYIP